MCKKNLVFVCVVLIVLLGVSDYNQYKMYTKANSNKNAFINHFYGELLQTIYSLDSLHEGDGVEVQSKIIGAGNHLVRLNSMIEDAHNFIDADLYYFNGCLRHLSYSISNELLSDGKISKTEMSFLTSLKEDLEHIKNQMYPDETGNKDPNLIVKQSYKLTIKDINIVLEPFVDKYMKFESFKISF